MFRAFSFDPVGRPTYSLYEADRAAMNVSPTSHVADLRCLYQRPRTPSPCTISHLAAQLHQQSLRVDPCYPSAAPSSPSLGDHHDVEPRSPRPTYSRVAASLLRMQRQSNSRMQCSASHVRDISALVRMIEEEEQCTVSDSKSRTLSESSSSSIESKSTVPDDDDDNDERRNMDCDHVTRELETLLGMQRWQSNERSGSCVRVTRTVRMRRRAGNGVQKRRSS